MNDFNIRKYQNENNTMVDGSDSLANLRHLIISFYHVPSKKSVSFKAFITTFNESYNSNFTPHETFGRTDPIYQYKNTTRKITLAFKVPAASESEAFENLGRISALEQMLYPSYSELDSATTLTQAPLIRIKVMNLLTRNYGSGNHQGTGAEQSELFSEEPRNVLYNSYKTDSDPKQGLLGVIDNFNVNHNLEGDDGVFFKRKQEEDPETGRLVAKAVPNTILPKLIDVNLAFSPIHEETLGWKDGDSMQSLFPYGVATDDTMPKLLNAITAPGAPEKFQKERDAELKRRTRQQMKDSKESRVADLKERLGMLGKKRLLLAKPELRDMADEALENAVEAGEDGDQFIRGNLD